MSQPVLAMRATCSHLLDPSTQSPLLSPLIALYEVEVPLTGADAGLPALVLKDAVSQSGDKRASAAPDPKAILVVHPTQAAKSAAASTSAASSSSASAASRQLHFRIYQRLAVEKREDSYLDDSDDEDSAAARPPRFQLLASVAVSWNELARSARENAPLQVQLTHPLSASANRALKAAGSLMTLQVRVASAVEASQERAFERLLELAHEDAYEGLAQRVPAEESAHRATLALAISTKLPLPPLSDDAAPQDSVYLAAIFERDAQSGSMRLAGLTPFTRPGLLPDSAEVDPVLRFPASVQVDYYPSDAQAWTVSLYRFSGAELSAALAGAAAAAGGVAARMPAALVAGLSDAQRIGSSAVFLLDYLGLESGFLQATRAAAEAGRSHNATAAAAAFKAPVSAPAEIGRVYAPAPNLVRMELAMEHDTDPKQDERLRAGSASITLQVDLASSTELRRHPSLLPSASSARSPSDTEIDRRNREQLLMLEQTLSAGGEAPLFELPADAFPDAEDVDVSGVDESSASSAEILPRLQAMMEAGQSFLRFPDAGSAAGGAAAGEPELLKVFYRNSEQGVAEGLPGLLYTCDVRDDPAQIDVGALEGLDLCAVTDIYLGQQSPAFHQGARASDEAINPDDDDTVSFSLVTAACSLHLQAATPQKRAMWILGVMKTLQENEAAEEEGQSEEPGQ